MSQIVENTFSFLITQFLAHFNDSPGTRVQFSGLCTFLRILYLKKVSDYFMRTVKIYFENEFFKSYRFQCLPI